MKANVQKEHEWLQRLLGEWTAEGEANDEIGEASEQHAGTESVRTVGNVWVMCESRSEMGGEPMTTVMTLGYDPTKGRFVGTFLGSMMTYLWIYEGTLDESGTTLTLDTTGPNFAPDAEPGTMSQYRDVIAFSDENRRTLTSHVMGEDGVWTQFMKMNYQRRIG